MTGEITIIPPGGLSIGSVWQPIETAPMDGTHVILFWPFVTDDGLVTSGRWYEPDRHNKTVDGYWYSDIVNGGATPPTHWMPLPPPPQV
jgi:hypothetical protein